MMIEPSQRSEPVSDAPWGPSGIMRLASSLLTHIGEDGPHELALDELRAAYPGTSWALVERAGHNVCEATASGEVSERDVRQLCAQLWGEQATLTVAGAIAEPATHEETRLFGTWPDGSGAPEVCLAVWTPIGIIGPTEGELAVMVTLVSKYVASSRRLTNLKTRMRIDDQTGVLTRWAVLELLNKERDRALRYSRNLSVLYVDIDELKAVNDTYGHEAGDELISRVARSLSTSLRGCDAVGRLGGDEFLVVLPETDAQGARAVMTRIRDNLAAQRCAFAEIERSPSVSMGCATMGEVEGESLLSLADARMLTHKRQGRRGRDNCRLSLDGFAAA